MSCRECSWFDSDGGFEGECRAHPPVCRPDTEFVWPEVRVDDWCGEFRAPKVPTIDIDTSEAP
jgi:hypothetical protein